MRHLAPFLTLALVVCLTPHVHALSAPLSPEELTAAADLIVEGHISDVICQGQPVVDGESTTSAYHAVLTIDTFVKPSEGQMTSVTLPFAAIVWDDEPPMMSCGWAPSYQVGESGLYYLQTAPNTELYTLVSWNAFEPDGDSAGEPLPSCEDTETEEDAGSTEEASDADGEMTDDASESEPDVGPDDVEECVEGEDCGDCGTCGGLGQCVEPPSCPECTSDSDCAEGQECVWIDSVTSACRSVDDSGSDASEDTPDGTSSEDDSAEDMSEDNASDSAPVDDTSPHDNESDADGSTTSNSGGCASGGSQGPLTLALIALGLLVTNMRRRMTHRVSVD